MCRHRVHAATSATRASLFDTALKQDIADNSVQHLALTKYVAILALAPVNRAWGAARDLCSGSSEATRQPAARDGMAGGGYPRRTRRATALLATLAVLDVSSYFMHCVGALRVVRDPLPLCRDKVKFGPVIYMDPTVRAATVSQFAWA